VFVIAIVSVSIAVSALQSANFWRSSPQEVAELRATIEDILTFTHVSDRGDSYPGPDRIVVTDYSAVLEGCWLSVTIERTNREFCELLDGRLRTRVVQNNLRYIGGFSVRENRGHYSLSFDSLFGVARMFPFREAVSREVSELCGGEVYTSEDDSHPNNILYPTEAIGEVSDLLTRYATEMCW
jgi:hypothetical protein